jgi:hypothetical protein
MLRCGPGVLLSSALEGANEGVDEEERVQQVSLFDPVLEAEALSGYGTVSD